LSIDCADNGAKAVDIYQAEMEKYDAILMDIQMPEKEIPIIVMTANVFQEDIDKCLAVGMNDHLGKPIDIDEVITKLRCYLQ
jgi:CheY-like chemotaxis protein